MAECHYEIDQSHTEQSSEMICANVCWEHILHLKGMKRLQTKAENADWTSLMELPTDTKEVHPVESECHISYDTQHPV
eukprot:6490760-Amphidinium_carterae.1